MAGVLSVTVGKLPPILCHADALIDCSGYFRTALGGDFAEKESKTMEIPWEEHSETCQIFLSWLSSRTDWGSHFTSSHLLLFLQCCRYFQVNDEIYQQVQQGIVLPKSYTELKPELQTVWVKEIIPFKIMEPVVVRVDDKLERLRFIFAWFNEKAANTDQDRQVLQTCDDFFAIRELVKNTLADKPRPPVQVATGQFGVMCTTSSWAAPGKSGVVSGPSTGFGQQSCRYCGNPNPQTGTGFSQMFKDIVTAYPIAANAIETVQMLGLFI